MKSCTTRLTLATWCNPPLNSAFGFGAPGSSPASASSCMSASPPNPPPKCQRKSRRDCINTAPSVREEKLASVEQHAAEVRHPVLFGMGGEQLRLLVTRRAAPDQPAGELDLLGTVCGMPLEARCECAGVDEDELVVEEGQSLRGRHRFSPLRRQRRTVSAIEALDEWIR